MGKGEIMALVCAMVWAMAVICYKRAGEVVPAFHLNLFKNTVGTLCFIATLLLLGLERPALPDRTFWMLCFSGFLGITVADTMMLRSLHLLGAGRAAIVNCLYTPSMILCAVLMLGDRLSLGQALGAALVVAGVLVVGLKSDWDTKQQQTAFVGIALGAAAMLIMAYAIVLVQPVLVSGEVPLVQFTTIRLAASVVAAFAYLIIAGRLHELAWMKNPDVPWVTLIGGALLGTFIGMGLWIAGFKYAEVTAAAILNQTSVFFIILFATLLLREPLTKRKVAGALLGVSGVVIATLW